MTTAIIIYLIWLLLSSLIAFAFYGWDKRQAERSRRRIPESTLHWLAVVGGWPGAYLGQRYFRHKTQKTSFQIMFWICAVSNLLLVSAAIYLLI